MQSAIENAFLFHWKAVAARNMPEPKTQVRFHPIRRWKLDFGWPEYKLGIELDGVGGGGHGHQVRCHSCGAIVRARRSNGAVGGPLLVPYPSHGSGGGMDRDAEKANAALIGGWRVLRYTSKRLADDPYGVIREVEGLLLSLIEESEKQ